MKRKRIIWSKEEEMDYTTVCDVRKRKRKASVHNMEISLMEAGRRDGKLIKKIGETVFLRTERED